MILPVRGYVAVELPPPLTKRIVALQRRWNETAGRHEVRLELVQRRHVGIVLEYFGAMPGPAFEAIALAVGRVARRTHPFDLSVGGFVALPAGDTPEVFGALVSDRRGRLEALRGAVRGAASRYGFELPTHETPPHVAIARYTKGGGTDLIAALAASEEARLDGVVPVERIALFRGDAMADGGFRYQAQTRFDLKDRSDDERPLEGAAIDIADALDAALGARSARRFARVAHVAGEEAQTASDDS